MNSGELKEVYRGHLEECLSHLFSKLSSQFPRNTPGAAAVMKPIADFCGVRIRSVSRWSLRDKLPDGKTLIKLMCFLDMAGYRIIELERVPIAKRNFTELIGFGLLNCEQAVEILGFASTVRWYEILIGDRGISREKEQKMWDAWKERKEELEHKKDQLRKLYRSDNPLRVFPKMEEVKPKASTKRIIAIISIMEGLLALLEESSFDKLPDGDLADLKRSADTVLSLSAHLSALSSRLIISEQGKGGK